MKNAHDRRSFPAESELALAAAAVRAGALVVFPTETVYGLGADAGSEEAVRRIFEAKGRPADNPLIVHVLSIEQIDGLVDRLSPAAEALLSTFSPGPLTLVLPAAGSVPRAVTAGLDTVAVRIPSHPVARALLERAAVPIAAPSANRSGEPSPTTVAMARASLGDAVSHYLDGGPCEVGLESTVATVEGSRVVVLRPGAVSARMMRDAVPGVEVEYSTALSGDESPRSPGLKHRHYRPRARVVLFAQERRSATVELAELLAVTDDEGPVTVGVIGVGDECDTIARCVRRGVAALGGPLRAGRQGSEPSVRIVERRAPSLEEYARYLYRWFGEMDEAGAALVVAHLPPERGIGRALRDRLERATGGAVIS